MKRLEVVESADGRKYLWKLEDGNTIESVYFRSIYASRQACISTQIGCNVGCSFCETGKQRSVRNLDADEIVDQVRETIAEQGMDGPLDTVSFAGMGEPLYNFDNMALACKIMKSESLTKQTVCFTSGVVPRIPMVAQTEVDLLFVSLHGTTNEARAKLIPSARRYTIEAILESCHEYYKLSTKKVWINYLLLQGINDSEGDMERVCDLLNPAEFAVRICRWNKISDRSFISSENGELFLSKLRSRNFTANLEAPYQEARAVGGGCGQLRSRKFLLDESQISGT
ncbi:MAG: radical SAM protein [Silvibacterium sp.]|jgi:23S rRNA (adenine2503-C2)-methyltransferase